MNLGPCTDAARVSPRSGYGIVYLDGKERRAHRVVWMAAHGPIPEGQEVRHRCDRPACIRLDHLELGTHAQNMADAVQRDRIAHGLRNARTKLSDEQVQEIRRRRAEGETCAALATAYGINDSTVSRLTTGRRRARVV